MIKSINFDEQEIIRNILSLHAPSGIIDCDPTYSIGNFYKKGLNQPKYKFDKYPQLPNVLESSSNKLPLENNSINTIMFDPPFVIGGAKYKESKEGSCIIAKRFMSFTSFDELKEMYSGSLKEFYRVLRENGIVIFKCQDCVSGGKQYFSHVWLMYEALKIGFYPKDFFILLAKNRITDKRKQQHSRKFHCYYWIFKKEKCKVIY